MKKMLSLMMRALCLAIVAAFVSLPDAAARSDRSDRRSGQESDELRTEMRQRRLKKIEDIEEHRLPSSSAQPVPTKKKSKPKAND